MASSSGIGPSLPRPVGVRLDPAAGDRGSATLDGEGSRSVPGIGIEAETRRIGRGRGILLRGGGADPVRGLRSTDPLTFKVYQPDRLVLGKRMEDHLRVAVCFWHSFNWPGSDVFGSGTFDRPWLDAGVGPDAPPGPKLDAAFEFLDEARRPVLLLPRSRHRAGGRARSPRRARTWTRCVDAGRGAHGPDRLRLLWGTANLFSHPRYAAGAATNPDPEVFAYAAAQVKDDAGDHQAAGRRELRPVGRP